MNEEPGILSDRIKGLAVENRALRNQPPVAPVAMAVPAPDRQDSLALAAGLAQEQAETARLTALVHELEAGLQAAQEQLAAGAGRYSDLHAAYLRLAEQRDRLEEEAEARYRQRLNMADQREAGQARRLEQFAANRDRLNRRIATLEGDNKALKARRDALTGRVEALEGQVQALTGQRDGLRERVKTLGEANRGNAARCEALRKRVEALVAAGKDRAAPARPAADVADAGGAGGADAGARRMLEQELRQARSQAQELALRLREAEQAKADMLNSRSWRVTRPLRASRALLARGRTS